MWNYEKKLQYPVNIKNPNPAYAKIILTQLGGPDGEMGATTRYMNQRYTMPYATGKAILTDIATEEADHFPYITFLPAYSLKNSEEQKTASFEICRRTRFFIHGVLFGLCALISNVCQNPNPDFLFVWPTLPFPVTARLHS